MKRFAVGLLISLCTLSASADEVVKKPVDVADTPEKLQAVIDAIHGQMVVDGRYEFVHPDQRRDIDADFAMMMGLLRGAGSVAAMKEPDRVKLFNAQEHLNGILTHTDRNRLICEHRAGIGSHIQTNTCQTVAEVERARAGSQKYMIDHDMDQNLNHATWQSMHSGH
jgi:hypothetical protein